MPRFRDIARGTRGRHPVDLPLASGEVTNVAVRALLDDEDEEIDRLAREHAKKLGVEDPKPGNTLYDRAFARFTILLSYSDPESPDEAPVPFFSSEEEIRLGLDRDRIAYLFEAQQIWQDRCAPQQLTLTGDEFVAKVVEVATSEDERPFLRMRPGLRWIFMRTTAAQCMSSLELKSHSGWGSDTTTSSAAKPLNS
jgi:hypothetical protein